MLTRYLDPCCRTLQIGLNVSLDAISRGNAVAGEASPEVYDPSSLHRGGGGLELLEEGSLRVLVADLIPQEDRPAFEFPGGITNIKLCALLNDNGC